MDSPEKVLSSPIKAMVVYYLGPSFRWAQLIAQMSKKYNPLVNTEEKKMVMFPFCDPMSFKMERVVHISLASDPFFDHYVN